MKRTWTLLAMFLALAMLVQSIRLFIPMIPGPVNMFLIGSLLNTIMVLSIWQTGSRWAAMIGGLLPFGAFAQGGWRQYGVHALGRSFSPEQAIISGASSKDRDFVWRYAGSPASDSSS